jgi:hypothetical protein
MKNTAYLVLLSILFYSCANDVQFSNPGFQGYKDNVLWKTNQMTATESATAGTVSIVAINSGETLKIDAQSSEVGTYYFGTSNQATKATFSTSIDGAATVFTTAAITGQVAGVETPLINVGTNYTSDCTLVNGEYVCNTSHQTTTTGTGAGLKVAIITSAGKVTQVKIASPGNYYKPGDIITISGGNGAAKFKVLNIMGSNGEIEITENDGKTISGKFKFNAVKNPTNPQISDILNFQYGEFYKVPITPAP